MHHTPLINTIAVVMLFFAAVATAQSTVSAPPDGALGGVQDSSRWERPQENLVYHFNNMYQPCDVA